MVHTELQKKLLDPIVDLHDPTGRSKMVASAQGSRVNTSVRLLSGTKTEEKSAKI